MPRRWWTLVAVGLATFMTYLDVLAQPVAARLRPYRTVALGITIIGAILRSRQGDALHHGGAPAPAFLDGYHAGLIVTIALVAIGAVVSYLSMRRAPDLTVAEAAGTRELTDTPAADEHPVTASQA